MRKAIVMVTFAFCLVTSVFAFTESAHLLKLKMRYPFGIIGDDYGLLTMADLEVNARNVLKSEMFKIDSISYPYWQCFEVTDVELLCDAFPYDETDKRVPALLVIRAVTPQMEHDYISRRVLSIEDCHSYRKDWEELINQEPYVCISGLRNESPRSRKGGRDYRSWVFDKFKTRKGCSAHVGDCAPAG